MKNNRQQQFSFRRYELKYLLTYKEAALIKNYLQHLLKPDPYVNSEDSYKVTSLYFDSPDLQFYRESEAGVKKRVKVRHRYYNNDKEHIFWEIKRKDSFIVNKNRCLAIKPEDDFVSQLKLLEVRHLLKPVVWISYDREAFVSTGNYLRVTFDTNLAARKANFLDLNESTDLTPILSNSVIMEVKFNGTLPYFMINLLHHYSLIPQAISKYRLAIDRAVMLRYRLWKIF